MAGDSALTDSAAFTPERLDAEWALPTRMPEFLDWIDDTKIAQETEVALAAFMDGEIAKKMPATLRNDLRAAGWLEAADWAAAHP